MIHSVLQCRLQIHTHVRSLTIINSHNSFLLILLHWMWGCVFGKDVSAKKVCVQNLMSTAVAAGDQKCWSGAVIDGGFGGPPQKMLNLVDLISCLLVHFWDGHYLSPITYYSFRFIAYILTCRAWISLHCIMQTYFMAIPPATAI